METRQILSISINELFNTDEKADEKIVNDFLVNKENINYLIGDYHRCHQHCAYFEQNMQNFGYEKTISGMIIEEDGQYLISLLDQTDASKEILEQITINSILILLFEEGYLRNFRQTIKTKQIENVSILDNDLSVSFLLQAVQLKVLYTTKQKFTFTALDGKIQKCLKLLKEIDEITI